MTFLFVIMFIIAVMGVCVFGFFYALTYSEGTSKRIWAGFHAVMFVVNLVNLIVVVTNKIL